MLENIKKEKNSKNLIEKISKACNENRSFYK